MMYLLLLLSFAHAQSVHFPDTLKPETRTSVPISPPISAGLSLGLGQFTGAPDNSRLSGFNSVGILGEYSFNKQFSVAASFDISNYDLQYTYFYPYWYWGSYRQYIAYTRDLSVTQTDLFIEPKYKIMNKRLSPVVGGILGASFRNFSSQNYYVYNSCVPNFSFPSYSFSVGGMAGISFDITKDITTEFDLQYVMPDNVPSYYSGVLSVKFNF